jgi:hypothetical protein
MGASIKDRRPPEILTTMVILYYISIFYCGISLKSQCAAIIHINNKVCFIYIFDEILIENTCLKTPL